MVEQCCILFPSKDHYSDNQVVSSNFKFFLLSTIVIKKFTRDISQKSLLRGSQFSMNTSIFVNRVEYSKVKPVHPFKRYELNWKVSFSIRTYRLRSNKTPCFHTVLVIFIPNKTVRVHCNTDKTKNSIGTKNIVTVFRGHSSFYHIRS